ncbi:MAG: hypothetical protein ACC682_08950 [Gemmatimonadota bacterium]
MDRRQRARSYRTTLGVAIGISVGVHILALAWVKLSVPTFDEPQQSRALQVLDIPNVWENSALEVVPLEAAIAFAPNGALEGASASSARVDLPEAGAAGADAAVAAIVPMSRLSGAAPNAPAISLSLAEATPIAQVTLARANRGVILRASGGGAAGESGFDFIATSDAARDAERSRGGGGRGGPGGIGIGGGGGGYCPTWGGVPLIGPTRGFGGIGIGANNPGLGIIGARPPNSGAINRFGPRISGGY